MPPVISVESLSKSYRLGVIGSGTFTNDLKVWVARMRGKPNPLLKIGQEDHGNRVGEEIWALKDVTFQVEQGEVLGIIGRNGAGKSTLLKILSRVTAPTSGSVKVKGRIASLLEVGTGFHPELTGRENIYLNGAILGMTKAEVKHRFDEIVEFAEIAKFIDTPVKLYSSGMYVRLAFAVAAHLESEILLVDEVLAVGDAEFQKKCLGKMGDVASKEGRTVLFVSHNMGAVQQLCQKSILISEGRVLLAGDSDKVIKRYLSAENNDISNPIINTEFHKIRSGIGGAKIVKIEIRNQDNQLSSIIGIAERINVLMQVEFLHDFSGIVIGIEIWNQKGIHLLNLRSDSQSKFFGPVKHNEIVDFFISIPGLPFYPGEYIIEPWLCEKKGKRLDHLHNAVTISLQSRHNLKAEDFFQPGKGILLIDCDWAIR
jgi:lipopolysaccharide transport system ATP-binding protein